MKLKYMIEGLDCANCANELESEILKIDGVESVNINFLMQRMNIEYSGNDDINFKINKVIKDSEPDVTIKRI